MATSSSPELRAVSRATRAWSIGSQPVGHYDAAGSNQSARTTSTNRDGTIHLWPRLDGPVALDAFSRASSRNATTVGSEVECQNQRPQLRASMTFYDHIITGWWWWELLSWLVGFCCTAAILGALMFYKGKKKPQYIISGKTMNAHIAVFAAVSKAVLILPVTGSWSVELGLVPKGEQALGFPPLR